MGGVGEELWPVKCSDVWWCTVAQHWSILRAIDPLQPPWQHIHLLRVSSLLIWCTLPFEIGHCGADWFSSCVVGNVPKPVQILWLRRFDLVPMCTIRPAGLNLQIWPFILSASAIVLQENNWSLIFFPHEHESVKWQLNPVAQRLHRFLFEK